MPETGDPLQSGAQQIFEKMVAKSPEDRYQEIEDLLTDIDRIDELEDEPDQEQLPVATPVEAKDVVEIDKQPAMVEALPASSATAVPVTEIPTTAMAIRIEDDGSITNLPSSENVIDLSGDAQAHICLLYTSDAADE